MSNRARNIFLICTVILPFIGYCVYYYAGVFKNAPYKFTEFQSIVFRYGDPGTMLNRFDSKTGEYQYVNARDSVVKMNLKLNSDQLLFLHRKAAELGFWDFPVDERGDTTARIDGTRPPRYYIEFNYKHKSKKVVYDANFYYVDPRLKDANQQLIKQIQQVLTEQEQKQKDK